jgi:transcriptional regulator with XRE-family HTH domain
MLTQAVAVYFRELREGRGFTQESLATAVDVSKRTVERLERSEGDISVEPFERIIAVLGASPEEVNYLATNPSAAVEEGKEFARTLLQFDPTPQSRVPQIAALRQDMSSAGIRVYIRTLREHQGVGRKALAEGIGIRIGALADWEDGRSSTIPTAALVRAVTYLGATVDDLDRITSAKCVARDSLDHARQLLEVDHPEQGDRAALEAKLKRLARLYQDGMIDDTAYERDRDAIRAKLTIASTSYH